MSALVRLVSLLPIYRDCVAITNPPPMCIHLSYMSSFDRIFPSLANNGVIKCTYSLKRPPWVLANNVVIDADWKLSTEWYMASDIFSWPLKWYDTSYSRICRYSTWRGTAFMISALPLNNLTIDVYRLSVSFMWRLVQTVTIDATIYLGRMHVKSL